jgi:hypothetical protein
MPLACSSRRKSNRSVNERPRRSTDQAATMSTSRRATDLSKASSAGPPLRPLAPEMPASSITSTTGPAVAFRDGVQFVALIGGRLLARRNAQIKLALMRFVLFSYFCTCWKVIPITSPNAV